MRSQINPALVDLAIIKRYGDLGFEVPTASMF